MPSVHKSKRYTLSERAERIAQRRQLMAVLQSQTRYRNIVTCDLLPLWREAATAIGGPISGAGKDASDSDNRQAIAARSVALSFAARDLRDLRAPGRRRIPAVASYLDVLQRMTERLGLMKDGAATLWAQQAIHDDVQRGRVDDYRDPDAGLTPVEFITITLPVLAGEDVKAIGDRAGDCPDWEALADAAAAEAAQRARAAVLALQAEREAGHQRRNSATDQRRVDDVAMLAAWLCGTLDYNPRSDRAILRRLQPIAERIGIDLPTA